MRADAPFPVRLRFTKYGPVRFISHRDVARAFERAFRIARLPLAFTRGFAPRPRVSFGLALSVGHESDAEYLDVELAEPVPPEPVAGDLTAALPPGIDVTGAVTLAPRAPALQEAVTAVAYVVTVVGADPMALGEAVASALGSSELPVSRTRKGQPVVEDARPALRRLIHVPGTTTLEVEIATQPRGIRPGEVVAALGDGFREDRVRRTHQWIERLGARLEPLEADARVHAPVDARAS